MKEKVYERAYIGYSMLMFLLCIGSFKYSIIPINVSLKILGHAVFYAIALFGTYSFYKVKKPNFIFAIALLFSGIFYSKNLIILAGILLVGLILLIKEYKLIFKAIILLMLILVGFKTLILILLGSNVGAEDYQKYISQDNNKTYVTVLHDEGATGISFSLWKETNLADIIYIRKKIEILNGNENIVWTKEGQLQVNGNLIEE